MCDYEDLKIVHFHWMSETFLLVLIKIDYTALNPKNLITTIKIDYIVVEHIYIPFDIE